jgi:MFS family permease
MLEDENMFNVDPDKIGRICSKLTIYSLPLSILMTFMSSYIYEILGRKLTIFTSFMFTSVILALFPYSSPNYNQLVAIRVAIGVTMAP